MDLSLQPLFNTLQGWLEGAIAVLPNLLVALAVLVVFYLAGRLVARLARRLGDGLGASPAILGLLSAMVKYAVLAGGFVIALGIVGLEGAVFSILAGAGVVGLAVGFAFQDLTANFIAGVAMGLRRPFDVGDIIDTEGGKGTVEAINLRNTVIKTFQGQRLIIPNRSVFENPLTNFHSHGSRRVDIDVGVAYDTDLAEATRIAREAVEQLSFREEGTDVDVFAHNFGGSSIDFSIRLWIPVPEVSFLQARHDAMLAIKRAFDEHEIDIPFPIRTLEFSGIESGAHPFEIVAPDTETAAA